jgi:hypothetical protein
MASQTRRRGRPKLGDVRIECSIPREAFNRLKEQEKVTGDYYTRIAANILNRALIGSIVTKYGNLVRFNDEGGTQV